MKRLTTLLVLSMCLTGAGCTTTQKGTTAGALGGGALGGIIGHQSGHGAEGAAIGAAVGGLGGYIVGEKMKKKFCPVGGEQYDESVTYCPKHGDELQYIEE
jgi:uncharacterized protein YcfJ